MPIVSISLTSKILEGSKRMELDRGYFSRSEVIRDAIRDKISEIDTTIDLD